MFALAQVERAHEAGANVIVHLGDFGFWVPGRVTKRFLLRLEGKLAELGLHLIFVDGNHEDQVRLLARRVDPETGLRVIYPHIHHIPRGFRWQWADRTGHRHVWMALGGAVSVDKHNRQAGRDWWPEEVLSEADVARAVEAGTVDVLVCHDASDGVHIPGLRPQDWPADVIVEADDHRKVLRTVVDAVRPRRIWHGHYHVRYGDRLDLGWSADRPDWSGGCAVQGLDCDQGGWPDNIALVGPDGARLLSSDEHASPALPGS